MPSSKRKLAANRANAQKSIGPVTAAGKEAASQNAFKHGLCGKFHVLSCEDQSEYDDLFNRFVEAEKPFDDVERELVAKMARHTWMSERAVRCQEACFLVQPQTPDDEVNRQDGIAVRTDLEMYLRYQAAHDRAYQRASNEVTKRRNERRKDENGFVSQKRSEAQEQRRETAEIRRVEVHTARMAQAQKKLERPVSQAAPYLARQTGLCQASAQPLPGVSPTQAAPQAGITA
jgi:hypothetical protein